MEVRSALDFLTKTAKVKDKDYEQWAHQAFQSFVQEGRDPTEVIAHIAEANNLNDEQTHRIIEIANHMINLHLANESQDQTFDFPVVTVHKVQDLRGKLRRPAPQPPQPEMMGPPPQPQMQPSPQMEPPPPEMLAQGQMDPRAMAIQEQMMAQLQPKMGSVEGSVFQLPKAAELMTNWRFQKWLSSGLTLPEKPKTAEKEPEYPKFMINNAEQRLEAQLSYLTYKAKELAQKLGSLYENGDPEYKDEFSLAVGAVFGKDDGKIVLKNLGAEKTALSKISDSRLDKLASYIDPKTEEYRLLTSLKETFQKIAETKEKLAVLRKG